MNIKNFAPSFGTKFTVSNQAGFFSNNNLTIDNLKSIKKASDKLGNNGINDELELVITQEAKDEENGRRIGGAVVLFKYKDYPNSKDVKTILNPFNITKKDITNPFYSFFGSLNPQAVTDKIIYAHKIISDRFNSKIKGQKQKLLNSLMRNGVVKNDNSTQYHFVQKIRENLN